jgi:hypothetical protein
VHKLCVFVCLHVVLCRQPAGGEDTNVVVCVDLWYVAVFCDAYLLTDLFLFAEVITHKLTGSTATNVMDGCVTGWRWRGRV